MRRATFLTTDDSVALTYHMVGSAPDLHSPRTRTLSATTKEPPVVPARRLSGPNAALARAVRARDRIAARAARPGRPSTPPRTRPTSRPGRGCASRDVDGNTYRDFLGNYTSLILGHAHPAVVAAVEAQVRRGSAFAAPTEIEVELAEEIRRRVPSIERLRFTSSGTEATMFAIRAARAFTGRPLVGQVRALVPRHARRRDGRDGRRSRASMSGLVVELPWGDTDGIEAVLRGREGDLAAIIIEPVQGAGGVRAPEPGFLDCSCERSPTASARC